MFHRAWPPAVCRAGRTMPRRSQRFRVDRSTPNVRAATALLTRGPGSVMRPTVSCSVPQMRQIEQSAGLAPQMRQLLYSPRMHQLPDRWRCAGSWSVAISPAGTESRVQGEGILFIQAAFRVQWWRVKGGRRPSRSDAKHP